MKKCPKCKRDSATHKIIVEVCPECGCILEAENLYKKLRQLGISQDVIDKIKCEIRTLNVAYIL